MNLQQPHKALVVSFLPTGQVESLHNDKFDLGFLGDKTIKRATEILFNEETQDWYIVLLDGNQAPRQSWAGQDGFTSYEQAREVEVAWLNLSRLNAADPGSAEGSIYLGMAKQAVVGH